jgi:hypothetical protein
MLNLTTPPPASSSPVGGHGDQARIGAPVGAPAGGGASSLGIVGRFAPRASQGCSADGPLQLHRFALQAGARDLVPDECVAKCLRRVIPGSSSVDLLYAPMVRAAFYRNLITCHSVWMCPVCCSKITERRRIELSTGLASWSGRVILASFTLQHNSSEALSVVLDGLLTAYRSLRSGRWPEFASDHSIVGSIRALEVTHGFNGWHPHLHVLMFLGSDLRIIPFEAALKEQWSRVLARSGRYASWSSGVDVRFSDKDIAAYVAKWGKEPRWTVAHEIAKAPVKAGRSGGRSPSQLLADYVAGSELSGALWREYALTFKGRKQLVWSRGLRALLGLVEAEKTDEELAAEQEEVAIVLAQLSLQDWRVVLGNDAVADLQVVGGSGDGEAVARFLSALGVKPCRMP